MTRLIDADDLKKSAIKKLGIASERWLLDSEKVIFEEIDNAPTVEVPQWIPVSERLPEDSYETDLIVTVGSGVVKFACFTKEDGFVSLTGFHRIPEVIAWMELPKPYEGEEE